MPNPASLVPTPPRRRRQWWKRILIVVGALLVLYGGWAAGVYGATWRGSKTTTVSQIAVLPAAMIGWQPLSLHAYLTQRQTVDHYTSYLSKNSPEVFSANQTPDSRQVAMSKILRDAATERLAKEFAVTVTATDLDQAFNAQLLQGGDRAETTKAIKDLYNWTPEQFKQHVLRVAVTREKLREKLSFDEKLNGSQRQQAERVYGLVQAAPTTFADLAKQYSEDVYGANGGDLGFFPRGEHASEIDEAVFALEVGGISELVHTKFGWHILRLEEKKEVDGQEQVHASQIFIAAPSVDAYITSKINEWGVRLFLTEFSWDAKTGQAVVK